MKRARGRAVALVVTALASIAIVAALPRIPQDPAYHHLADDRTWLGIPNALNVLSNAGFAIVGISGLVALARRGVVRLQEGRERWAYVWFFVGIALTSLGSAYYHLAPSNARLTWDRLPMTLGFMGLLAAVLGERVDVKLGSRILVPLLGLGVASVFYWEATERTGAGDLRPYALVQFAPAPLIALLLAAWPGRYTRGGDFVAVLAVYGLAKVLEWLDRPIFELGRLVSGHTLKHLVAAAAAGLVLRMLWRRTPQADPRRRDSALV
jgi:hypothetical protein